MEMVPIKNHKRPLKTPEIKGCTAWGCRVPAPSFIAERGNHARSNVQPVAALICSKNSPHCMESPAQKHVRDLSSPTKPPSPAPSSLTPTACRAPPPPDIPIAAVAAARVSPHGFHKQGQAAAADRRQRTGYLRGDVRQCQQAAVLNPAPLWLTTREGHAAVSLLVVRKGDAQQRQQAAALNPAPLSGPNKAYNISVARHPKQQGTVHARVPWHSNTAAVAMILCMPAYLQDAERVVQDPLGVCDVVTDGKWGA
eukprot:1151432-Pelagomonas_calceolata.AAC.3